MSSKRFPIFRDSRSNCEHFNGSNVRKCQITTAMYIQHLNVLTCLLLRRQVTYVKMKAVFNLTMFGSWSSIWKLHVLYGIVNVEASPLHWSNFRTQQLDVNFYRYGWSKTTFVFTRATRRLSDRCDFEHFDISKKNGSVAMFTIWTCECDNEIE